VQGLTIEVIILISGMMGSSAKTTVMAGFSGRGGPFLQRVTFIALAREMSLPLSTSPSGGEAAGRLWLEPRKKTVRSAAVANAKSFAWLCPPRMTSENDHHEEQSVTNQSCFKGH
jgi:hypothetical protein